MLRNTGEGSFEDVTQASGIVTGRNGAANAGRAGPVHIFADVDNDGDLDLYAADRIADNKLFGNEGGVFTQMFPDAGPRFYSSVMGAHQRLPNGNWLILSTMEGRVFEVTETGETVREYSNIINDTYNAVVPHIEFLPLNYFDEMPKCVSQ